MKKGKQKVDLLWFTESKTKVVSFVLKSNVESIIREEAIFKLDIPERTKISVKKCENLIYALELPVDIWLQDGTPLPVSEGKVFNYYVYGSGENK